MFNQKFPYWVHLAAKTAGVVILLILIASQALAAPVCKKINGKFTLQTVPEPACTSSVGICAAGTFSGDLAGTSLFTATSLIQNIDTPTTSVVFATGDTTITTRNGTLLTKNAVSLSTSDPGEFAEVNSIIGGTGQWAGSTGKFTATGTYFNGSGSGSYGGEICNP